MDKVGSIFTSSATQHSGQESTILGFSTLLFHHAMIFLSVSYTYPGISVQNEISGGGPYGSLSMPDNGIGEFPTDDELATVCFQGRRLAEITKKMICK